MPPVQYIITCAHVALRVSMEKKFPVFVDGHDDDNGVLVLLLMIMVIFLLLSLLLVVIVVVMSI